MILYATTTASSPSSSKEAEKQQIVHNLELANGQPKYSFRVGSEIHGHYFLGGNNYCPNIFYLKKSFWPIKKCLWTSGQQFES
jgi:hypothetical protein